ncbi:MAG: tRNA epoxyqueuosine(34) reductase QueG [Anaerolineales bacterium]|nr:tRNA epoxyqueuosine(34) reductase QueG [Anaerolineales bacterium]
MIIDANSLEKQIKSTAYRLGFALVGITTPDSPRSFENYRRWIDAGRHAGMGYLATERALKRREDPRRILPECKSIIVTGTSYLPRNHFAASEKASARVASYALGEDYHDVIASRLEELARAVELLVGRSIPYKVYTDTGPILERDLAQRAGIGWIGKNSCLINPDRGSYFLLGEILLGVSLQPDPPFQSDHCGSCTRCIEACPTQCILAERTVDANRCVSYLTIEEKGVIPHELRAGVANWLFGCDICQQVCPWNKRFARATGDPAFQARPQLQAPDLAAFLELKPESWLSGFRHSPLERPRRRGLVRNAAVVAGNRADTSQIEALLNLLSDPEPIVRGHAAWAIGRLDVSAGNDALQEALESEEDPYVIEEIRNALR